MKANGLWVESFKTPVAFTSHTHIQVGGRFCLWQFVEFDGIWQSSQGIIEACDNADFKLRKESILFLK
jgi:hypothetical protein